MIEFLTDDDICEINREVLGATRFEQGLYALDYPGYLELIHRYVVSFKDCYRIATAYAVSLIVFHIFREANHRTSLLSAETFLLNNDLRLRSDPGSMDDERLELHRWRLEHEEENDLEPYHFLRIEHIVDWDRQRSEMDILMDQEYGGTIEQWLRRHYERL